MIKYLLLCILFISPARGGLCLELTDDEKSNKNLFRVLRVITNYWVENKETITHFLVQEKERVLLISQGMSFKIRFYPETRRMLRNMRMQPHTDIGQDYGTDPAKLRQHLCIIRNVLFSDSGPSDLDDQQIIVLDRYLNLLLFLSRF